MAQQFLTVYDRLGRPVRAKTLVDAYGNDVINPATASPYIVPADYFVQDSIDLGNQYRAMLDPTANPGYVVTEALTVFGSIAPDFKTNGPQDLQRSYNGLVGQGGEGFVSEFTDAASFHYGLALRTAGFDSETAMAAGGLLNRYNWLFNANVDISGPWGINPNVDEDVTAGAQFYMSGRWGGRPLVPPSMNPVPVIPCFAAGTPILLADGTSRAIEDIVPGDTIAAFNENDSLGRADLRSATVARLLPGVTEEWIVFEDGTRVTPGHRYLTEHGTWATAADLIASDIRAVAADGSFVPLRGTLLRATDANSDAEWVAPEPQLYASLGVAH